MSRMQEPHRPLFHFGNPFRKVPNKSSQLSSKLEARVNEFEETLSARLRRLIPRSKDDILSLSWMILAVQSLCESHNDIKMLITKLELPPSAWDEKWIDVYLDISVKLLDICNAFTSELSRLNQGSLVIQCFLHKLDLASTKGAFLPHSALDGWKQHLSSTGRRTDNFCTILDSLVGSLDLPKVKNSTKGKLLMRAMYGVKVETVFICSVFASAFSGNANKLFDNNVADTFKWAGSFSDLRTRVNGEIRSIYLDGRFTPLKELEAVDVRVKTLYPLMQQEGVKTTEAKEFRDTVSELGRTANEFSQGLDLLTKEVDGFFHIVLDGRDALLSTLRSDETM